MSVTSINADSNYVEDVLGCVEHFNDGVILGWAVSLKGVPLNFSVLVNGAEYPVNVGKCNRDDIADKYGAKAMESGFVLSLSSLGERLAENLANPEAEIELMVNGVCLDWRDGKPGEVVPVKECNRNEKNEGLQGGYVDAVSDFVIKGWAVNKNNETECFEVRVNEKILPCQVIRTERADVAKLFGEESANPGFEIYLPGCMWELMDENGVCEVSVVVQGEAVNKSPIILERIDVVEWVERLCESEFDNGSDYAGLFALEHVKYSDVYRILTEEGRLYVNDMASRMRLSEFLHGDREAGLDVANHQVESMSSIMLREAMVELNAFMETADGRIYPLVEKVYKKYALRGAAKEWYLNLAVQLTCSSDEFDKLSALTDFHYLNSLRSSQQPHQLALLLPVMVVNAEIEKATEILRQIARYIENSWLPTECIAYSVNVVNKLVLESRVSMHAAERFRKAFIAVLDGFKTGWFSRLHDEQLVSAMANLLAESEFYTDYHKRELTLAAIRLYGLCPVFWRYKNKRVSPCVKGELNVAQEAWERLKTSIEASQDSAQDELMSAFESLEYFRSRGNGEALIMLRDLVVGLIGASERKGGVLIESAMKRLVAADNGETLRLMVHPALQHDKKGYDLHAREIMHGLRNLNDYHKSAVYDIQLTASKSLVLLAECLSVSDEAEKDRVAKILLTEIKKNAALLGTWQGMFVGADLLVSAYQIASLYEINMPSLLMDAIEMIRVAVNECGSEHVLAAPVCSVIARAVAMDGGQNLRCFVNEVKGIVAARFGSRYERLFLHSNGQLKSGAGYGWPKDTLVIVDTSQDALETLCVSLRETWLQDLKEKGVPYVFVVGDGDEGLKGDVLYVDAPDDKGSRLDKTLKTYEWVLRNCPDIQYVVAISDRCFMSVERYFNSLSYRKYHYYGKVMRCGQGKINRLWHKPYVDNDSDRKSLDKTSVNTGFVNGDFCVSVSAFAMKELCDIANTLQGKRVRTQTYCRDKAMAELLLMRGITPSDEDFDVYTDESQLHELASEERHANGFHPGKYSPAKLARLTNNESMSRIYGNARSDELWPKKIWPTFQKPSLKPNANQLELLTDADAVGALLREEIILVSVVRNEKVMLPQFLAYYRNIGVNCFIFVDNDSDDGTREYLLTQKDTIVYSTDAEYKSSHYGVSWQQAVMGNHCLGKWVLLADADEFLVYENSETKSLNEYVNEVELDGSNGIQIYMVDMYPYGDLDSAEFERNPVFEVAPYFDKNALIELRFGGGMYSNSRNFVNGLRHRIAPSRINSYVSQKYALFRYYPWIRLCEGAHYAANMCVSPRKAFFAHFKYHAGFKEKVALEVKRKQHFNGAEEYRRYASMIAEVSGGFGEEGVSELYEDSSSFIRMASRLGLL